MLLETTMLWLVALGAVALWVAQNAQHEYAHIVAHRRYGAVNTTFVPFPTSYDGSFSVRFWMPGFTWAHMTYSQPKDRPLTNGERAVTAIAPQATNTVILMALLVLHWVADLPPAVSAIFLAWYITNFVDGAWNLGTFYKWWVTEDSQKHTDGWKFQKSLDLNPWLCRVGAGVWHLWFGFHLFVPTSVFA
jgi:hypothetical protein